MHVVQLVPRAALDGTVTPRTFAATPIKSRRLKFEYIRLLGDLQIYGKLNS